MSENFALCFGEHIRSLQRRYNIPTTIREGAEHRDICRKINEGFIEGAAHRNMKSIARFAIIWILGSNDLKTMLRCVAP